MKILKYTFWIFCFLVITGVGLGYYAHKAQQPKTWKDVLPKPEHTKVDETKPLREQTRTIELAGRTFEIPLMYVDAPLEPGLKQDGLLLEVIWPEMRSIYELKDKAEYEKIWKEEKRRGWILLEPAENRPALEVQVGNLQRSMTKFELLGSAYGLEKRLWYRGTPENPELKHEVYLQKDELGKISVFIECSRGSGVIVPGCSHKFVDGHLIYKIRYNEAVFFSEWGEQQQRAIKFINELEVMPQTEAGKGR